MDAMPRPSGGLPLWPLPLLCALLPMLVSHVAWWLSLRHGLIPACNPYLDGCVSISRAARHGPGNDLFRMVMLPMAALQVLCWLAAALWLRRHAARVRWLPWLGLASGLFLALYATYLGSEGAIYQVMRRYGITMYFASTFLAWLTLLGGLSQQSPRPAGYRPSLVVALGYMLLGLAHLAIRFATTDAALRYRWENVLEWQLGLWLTAMFSLLAWAWWREEIRVSLR